MIGVCRWIFKQSNLFTALVLTRNSLPDKRFKPESNPTIFWNLDLNLPVIKAALLKWMRRVHSNLCKSSWTSAPFNLHVRKLAEDHGPLLVQVEHRDVRHLLTGTAGSDAPIEVLCEGTVVIIIYLDTWREHIVKGVLLTRQVTHPENSLLNRSWPRTSWGRVPSPSRTRRSRWWEARGSTGWPDHENRNDY